MELFATDRDRLAFLLETDAALDLDFETLEALAGEVSEEQPPEKRPKYITNYIGSKQKLVDWIWKYTPDGVDSVVDAFSGSAVVAYMYKTKGLRVLANDRLRYCYHAARAIVENRNVRLTDEDLEALLADNSKAGSFVRDNFKGIFFAKGVHGLIDTIRANIDKLSGFKKDIALFALGKTCMSGKGGFGHFSSSTRYGKREDTPEEFKERFRKNVARINALVFDNGKECKAFRKDINKFLQNVKADLAYFDPPYATEFSTTNYEKAYHFVEGLMTYWDGLTLVEGSKTKHYETDHKTVTRANAKEFFETFLGNAQHIPNWLISYRDHAYPNEREMRGIITAHGFEPAMRSRDHHYAITSRHGDASHAKERLFICKHGKGRSVKADAAAESMRSQAVWEETENEIRYRVMDPERFEPDSFRRKTLEGVDGVSIIIGRLKKEFVQEGDNPRSMLLQAYRFARKTERNPDGWTIEKAKEWIKEHESKETAAATMCAEEDLKVLAACHTSIPVELCFSETGDLCAEALDFVKDDGDPQFTFVLCRAGTNKNGDHFTPEELAARYMTAVNKKIDLKHSQDFTDIVGGIVAADFIEDDRGGRIECAGELYVSDSQHSQLAYKLIRKGIISQVSMECDYEEGECSICGKRVQSKNDYCIHLRKNKGGAFQGKPVYEILHGVTFTGLGLLDRKGADENARITQVASEQGEVSETLNEGGPTVDEKQKAKDEAVEAAKKTEDGGGNAADDKARIKELEKENKELKQQVLALQKQVEEMEAERKAAANRARAQKLLSKVEKHGIAFESDEERVKELTRLAGLSDEAFTATEDAFDRMIRANAEKAEKEKPESGKTSGKEQAKAGAERDESPMRSDAGVRPKDVDDRKKSLEDKLKNGFMAAYHQRVGLTTGEPVQTN